MLASIAEREQFRMKFKIDIEHIILRSLPIFIGAQASRARSLM